MFKNLDYRTIRALHICIVFASSIFIAQQFQIPRGAWTGFTVMMIYVGFDSGSSIQRTIHRFFGVLLGLFFAHIIWFIGHLNYRILFLIIPCLLLCYYYLLGKTYAFPTVFTTALSAIGTDYFASKTFYVQWFFRDYFMCTLLAVFICLFFEFFIFRGFNMTRKFYIDLQKEIIINLENLLTLMQQPKIKKSDFLRMIVVFNKKVTELNTFTQNTRHDYHNKDNLLAELDEFHFYMNTAYHNLRKIFILPVEKHFLLLQDTASLIQKLQQIIDIQKAEH